MIALLLRGFLSIVSALFNWFVEPINNAIVNVFPNVNDVISNIGDFFDLILRYVRFVLSYTGLYPATINILLLLAIPIITIPIGVHAFKLVAKWWEVLV